MSKIVVQNILSRKSIKKTQLKKKEGIAWFSNILYD